MLLNFVFEDLYFSQQTPSKESNEEELPVAVLGPDESSLNNNNYCTLPPEKVKETLKAETLLPAPPATVTSDCKKNQPTSQVQVGFFFK